MDKHTDTNNDAKLKDRMNFTKMMERQEKQINETPHIKNLLTPSTQNINESSNTSADNEKFEKIEQKLERIEGLIEASRISRIENALAEPAPIKREFKINNPKPLYALALSLTIVGFSLIMTKATPVTKVKTVKVAPKVIPMHVITDYINLRAKPSGSAKKLTVLAPNFTVELIKSKGDWHNIKYRDHLNNKDLVGWVYGNNFKAL